MFIIILLLICLSCPVVNKLSLKHLFIINFVSFLGFYQHSVGIIILLSKFDAFCLWFLKLSLFFLAILSI